MKAAGGLAVRTRMKCPATQSQSPTLEDEIPHDVQSRIFFSSGHAQMKGGGDFCIATYSCSTISPP